MSILEIQDQGSGETLGRIILEDGVLSFSDEQAERMFRSRKGLYLSDAEAFEAMSESSNGYLSFRIVR